MIGMLSMSWISGESFSIGCILNYFFPCLERANLLMRDTINSSTERFCVSANCFASLYAAELNVIVAILLPFYDSRCKFKNFSPILQTFLGNSALAVLTKGEGEESIKTIMFI